MIDGASFDHALETLDYARVAEYMRSERWYWHASRRVPNAEQMRFCIRDLMWDALEGALEDCHGCAEVSSGGWNVVISDRPRIWFGKRRGPAIAEMAVKKAGRK